MTKHVHGGNVYKYSSCVDFSANCNPLGTPASVKQAVIEALEHVADYPQVGYAPLREALSQYEKINKEHIICGNGAADLIFSLCYSMKPKKALLPAPTFAEYEQALRCVGCEITYYFMKEEQGFVLEEDFLSRLDASLDVVFICNPNNPTGVLTERSFLLKILQKCKELGIFLVVDECFQDFIEKPDSYSLKEYITEYENLFLLKAFTKRYAMAGIRLGYGLSGNEALLEKMEGAVQPWNVSTLAQAAGVAALKETEYVEKSRKLIFEEKSWMIRKMQELGYKTYASNANYVFFQGRESLFEDCVEKNILIRDCSNYPGLKKGFFRVAVKTHKDNEKLVEALREIEGRQ